VSRQATVESGFCDFAQKDGVGALRGRVGCALTVVVGINCHDQLWSDSCGRY